jgi:hypothetical protein
MKRRKIYPLSLTEIEALSTKQLLARLKRLHECEESLALSDRQAASGDGSIEFKQSPEWDSEYQNVKTTLAHREHVKR